MDEYLSLRSIHEKPCRLAVRSLIHISGNRPVDSYTRRDARALVSHLLRQGNKTATVRRRLQSLHAVFEYGLLEMEVDRRNPFSRVPIPKDGQDIKVRDTFAVDQLRKIYADALNSEKDTRLILPILGETGARLAEIVGLRWDDVDLEAGTIIIQPHALRPLKTRGSERMVPLGPLSHKTLMCSEGDGAPLFLSALYRHETHARAVGCFGSGLGVGTVILLALHERLHIGSGDQPHLMAIRLGNTAPMMRRRTGLHRYGAMRLLRQ